MPKDLATAAILQLLQQPIVRHQWKETIWHRSGLLLGLRDRLDLVRGRILDRGVLLPTTFKYGSGRLGLKALDGKCRARCMSPRRERRPARRSLHRGPHLAEAGIRHALRRQWTAIF